MFKFLLVYKNTNHDPCFRNKDLRVLVHDFGGEDARSEYEGGQSIPNQVGLNREWWQTSNRPRVWILEFRSSLFAMMTI
jgi:hypothetical protein